jgi:hypothetical protein
VTIQWLSAHRGFTHRTICAAQGYCRPGVDTAPLIGAEAGAAIASTRKAPLKRLFGACPVGRFFTGIRQSAGTPRAFGLGMEEPGLRRHSRLHESCTRSGRRWRSSWVELASFSEHHAVRFRQASLTRGSLLYRIATTSSYGRRGSLSVCLLSARIASSLSSADVCQALSVCFGLLADEAATSTQACFGQIRQPAYGVVLAHAGLQAEGDGSLWLGEVARDRSDAQRFT